MTSNFVTRSTSLAALVLPLALSGVSPAAILTYDADTATTGAQDGAGAGWNTSASNMWNGSGDVTWPNTTADEAIFGAGSGTAGTVTAGTVTANRITFNTPGSGNYTLSGGTITLGGSTPTITANVNATISSVLSGGGGMTKSGIGTLVLTGNNAYGNATVNAGTLQIGNGTSNGTIGTGNYALGTNTRLHLNYATAVGGTVGSVDYLGRISGTGSLELSSAQSVTGVANWGPNSNTAVPFAAGFNGMLKINRGRFDSQPSGLGAMTKLILGDGSQFLAWTGTYNVPIEMTGNGWGETGQTGVLRVAGGHNATFNNTITLTGHAGINSQDGGSTMTINGVISGGFNVTKVNGGLLIFGGANSYTGTTTVSGGTLRLNHQQALQNSILTTGGVTFGTGSSSYLLGGLQGSGTLTLVDTVPAPITLSIGNNNAETIFSGTLTGAGNLAKVGSGISRLTGTTSYTGTTAVNAGTLQVPTGTAITGACTVANGATLAVAGSSAQSWRTTGLTLGTGGATTLSMPVIAAGMAAPIEVTGLTTLVTSGTVTVNVPQPFTSGTFPLIEYPTGGSIGGAGIGAFTMGTLPPGIQASVVNDPGNTRINLEVTVNSFVWQGSPGATWDTGVTTAWTLAATPSTFQAGGIALFDDNASGSTSVAIPASVAPYSVTVNNSSKNYTFTGVGPISGATGLLKNGSGTLTITNPNTYTGATTVSAGTLKIGDGTTDGSLASPIANNASLVFDNSGSTSHSGGLSGGASATIVKQGAGTLTLTGTNSFAGSTTVNAGTLRLGNAATNATFAAGSYVVPLGGRILVDNLTAATYTGLASKVTGNGLIELNTPQAVNGTANWNAATFPAGFNGTLQINRGRTDIVPASVGGMSKMVIKDGAQFLGWAGTYPSNLAIDIAGNGWGENGFPGALRLAAGQVGTWAGAITLTANAGIFSQDTNTNFTLTGQITGPYECNFIRNGSIIVAPASLTQNSYGSTRISSNGGTGFVSAGNQYAFSTGPLTMDGGVLALNGFNSTFASLTGTTGEIRNNHATDPAVLTVGGSGDTTFAGSLIDGVTSGGKLSLVKTGTGALHLTGTATYSGDTTVSGGLLQVPAAAAASGICTVAGGSQLVITGAAGTQWENSDLNLGASSILTIRNFHSNLNDPPVWAVNAMTTAGTVTVNVAGTFTTTGIYPLIWYPGSSIGGAGYGALALGPLPRGVVANLQDNPGALQVELNVTAINPVKWKGNLSSAWNINTTQNWTLAGSPDVYLEGDTLLFDDTASTFTVALAGNVAPGPVTFDHTSNNYILSGTSGVITGTKSLTKMGGGTLTVTGAHTYTGGTAVNAGTLQLGDGTTLGSLAGTITNDANITFSHSLAQTFPATINGTGSLTKIGSGTLNLSGPPAGSPAVPTSNSAFGGNITINGGKLVGAAVRTGNNTVFGSANNNRTITANAGTTLEFQAPNTFGNHNVTAVPTLVVNNATVTNSDPLATNRINNGLRNVTLNNGVLTATVGNGTSLIGGTRTGEGYGCWGLNGTVTSSGTSVISSTATGMAGRILLGSHDADTIMNVLDGTLTVSAPLQAGEATTLGGLQKTGPGKLVLSSANNIYNTATTVTAGTLELTGSLIGAPGGTSPSSITVASGATLTGTGTGAGTLTANGIVAPGLSIGTLSTGAASFGATGSLNVEINANSLAADKLAITGNLSITAGATLSVTDLGSGTPVAGKRVIISYTGTWNGGTFASLPDDSTFTVNGNLYLINYNDSVSGVNSVTLTPSSDPFPDWAANRYGLSGGDADKTADPDKDGVQNILEFATDSNPTSGSSGARVYPLMFTLGADKALTYTVAVRKSAVFAASGNKQTAIKDQLLYTIEASNELTNWTTVPVTEVTGADATAIRAALGSKLTSPALGVDWEWHTFRTDAGAQVDPTDFIRLQVTTSP